MSFPKVHGTGQIISDPKSGPTKSGGTWCNAVVKFARHRKQANGTWTEVESFIAVVMAFDDQADALAGLAKGDNVEVVGAASVGQWNGNPQMRITASGVRRPVKAANALPAGRQGPRPDVAPTSPRTRTHLQVVPR